METPPGDKTRAGKGPAHAKQTWRTSMLPVFFDRVVMLVEHRRRASARRRSRAAFARMDARTLRDIGLTPQGFKEAALDAVNDNPRILRRSA